VTFGFDAVDVEVERELLGVLGHRGSFEGGFSRDLQGVSSPKARRDSAESPLRQTAAVLVVHGTKKFLDRAGELDPADEGMSTTVLGSWYATVWFWRPQVALFVNETTLLPVLVPMAPATTVVQRFVSGLPETFAEYGLDPRFSDAEVREMADHRLAKTASRSVLGVMNEFKHMAEHYRYTVDDIDLQDLAAWLAQTPCGPLFMTHVSPDAALRAAVTEHMP
jgi:hypothetical protein